MRRWIVVPCLVAGSGLSCSAQTFRENAKLERCFAETSCGDVRPEARSAVTVPAGTRVLMALSSPLHTTSAQKESGVYLVTTWPVVENDAVVIPACTRVMGVVEQDRRPGRVKGRAQFRFRFTNLILPNDHVVRIQGGLQSLPGDEKNRTQDAEGTIEPVDQIDRDVYTVAKGVVAGGLAGAITRSGRAAGTGMGIGGGLALGKVLFTRGDEIRLPQGAKVEMVLQQAVVIDRQ
jgi:hypothetical protein